MNKVSTRNIYYKHGFVRKFVRNRIVGSVNFLPEIIAFIIFGIISDWFESLFRNSTITTLSFFLVFLIPFLTYLAIAFYNILVRGFVSVIILAMLFFLYSALKALIFWEPLFPDAEPFVIWLFSFLFLIAIVALADHLPPKKFTLAIIQNRLTGNFGKLKENGIDITHVSSILIERHSIILPKPKPKKKLSIKPSYPLNANMWKVSLILTTNRTVEIYDVNTNEYKSRILSNKYTIEILDTNEYKSRKPTWFKNNHVNSFEFIQELVNWLSSSQNATVIDQAGEPLLEYTAYEDYQILKQLQSPVVQKESKKDKIIQDSPENLESDYELMLTSIVNGYKYRLHPRLNLPSWIIFPRFLNFSMIGALILVVVNIVILSSKGIAFINDEFYKMNFVLVVYFTYFFLRKATVVDLEISGNTVTIIRRAGFFAYQTRKVYLANLIGIITFDERIELVSINNRLILPGKYIRAHRKQIISKIIHTLKLVARFSSKVVFELEAYSCYNCDAILDTNDKNCSNCNVLAPKCIICYLEPRASDEIVQYSCCSSYAHLLHARKWNETKDHCPYCKHASPKIQMIGSS